MSPWLVWLSGLSASLQTKGLLVQFPVRAHAWIAGQVSGGRVYERQPHIDVSLSPSLPPSLPIRLKINKIFKKTKKCQFFRYTHEVPKSVKNWPRLLIWRVVNPQLELRQPEFSYMASNSSHDSSEPGSA